MEGENQQVSHLVEHHGLTTEAVCLLDVIKQHAGCTVHEAKGRTGFAQRTLERSVKELERSELACRLINQKETRLFPRLNEIDPLWKQFTTLCKPRYREFYDLVFSRGTNSFRELARHVENMTGLHSQTTRRRLGKLQKAGLVTLYRNNNDLRQIRFEVHPVDPVVVRILDRHQTLGHNQE